MGLLDDAIREHLELKRRAGADPGEIARTENEALLPVLPEIDATHDESGRAAGLAGGGEAEAGEYGSSVGDGEDLAAPQATGLGEAGEETAELDMHAVLNPPEQPHDGLGVGERWGAGADAAPVRAAPSGIGQGDSLEWEVPGEEPDAPPTEIPGQEKLSFE
jgi:hypothetical protein